MMLRKYFHVVVLVFTISLSTSDAPAEVIKTIFDFDMLTDCDDAGLLAMAHAFADDGEIEILATLLNGSDNNDKHGAVVSAINHYYGRKNIPIGVSKRPDSNVQNKSSSYSRQVWDEFPHDGLLDADRPDAVAVFRAALSKAPDKSVVIIAVGFMINLEDLLKSGGDEIDGRNGLDLVKAKVKGAVITGGTFPSGNGAYNFNFDNPGESASDDATKYVMENWPDKEAPIMFSGEEIGLKIITGKVYNDRLTDSPVKRTYELAYQALVKGRPSWDQTALLYAVRGLSHDDTTYWTARTTGHIAIGEAGSNTWASSPDKNHSYLIKAADPSVIAKIIDDYMTRPPRRLSQNR
jgi:hypothetical protein